MGIGGQRRSISELELLAAKYWPGKLARLEEEASVIPLLLQTQDQFIAIISIDVESHHQLFQVVSASRMPANIFLKHLSVIADVGGEVLQRHNRNFADLFPNGVLEYVRNEQKYSYRFKVLPARGKLDNKRLKLDGKGLLTSRSMNELYEDIAMLLMFGSTCTTERTAEVLAKCEIGTYLGDVERLKTFVKQRYIFVSKITSGAQSNALGQIAQKYIKDYLKAHLPDYDFHHNRVPGIVHSEKGQTSFDVAVTNGTKWVAIEVSFQVTTNSVIERKAGQAKSRYEQMERNGYKIAYVIDGTGNFERSSAVSVILAYSHCTVAFTDQELDVLVQFIREYFEG